MRNHRYETTSHPRFQSSHILSTHWLFPCFENPFFTTACSVILCSYSVHYSRASQFWLIHPRRLLYYLTCLLASSTRSSLIDRLCVSYSVPLKSPLLVSYKYPMIALVILSSSTRPEQLSSPARSIHFRIRVSLHCLLPLLFCLAL